LPERFTQARGKPGDCREELNQKQVSEDEQPSYGGEREAEEFDYEEERESLQSEVDVPEPDSFISQTPRRFVSCKSDEIMLSRISEEWKFSFGEGMGEFFSITVYDPFRNCRKCMRRLLYSTEDSELLPELAIPIFRKVDLHTLNMGTLRITVADLICPWCDTIHRYDGEHDGLFSINPSSVYTRELLDLWVYQVCGLSMTFREAFDSFNFIQKLGSSKLARHGNTSKCKRRLSNTAFTAFLGTLEFPEEVLRHIFACDTCEKKTADTADEKVIEAVVIDGTAVGLLGTLPPFARETALVPRVKGAIMPNLYLLRTPAVRRFLDDLWRSSLRSIDSDTFDVSITARAASLNVVEFLFGQVQSVKTDNISLPRVRAALDFVNTCFIKIPQAETGEMNIKKEEGLSEESDSDGEQKTKRRDGSARFMHRLKRLDFRVAASDVGRCFISASIGGILRSQKSEEAAIRISESSLYISVCTHSIRVCDNCMTGFYNTCRELRDELPSASRFGLELFETRYSSDDCNIRQIAKSLWRLLEQSVVARHQYLEAFMNEVPEITQQYTTEHRDGTGVVQGTYNSLMEEAQAMGEIYPGRPVVRPRVDFGTTSIQENGKTCAKSYVRSKSHSPGLFTVQCCCRHPKLIGISVMDACEGVSTALSAILSRFKTLPRFVFYDNGCNLSKSVTIRFPWIPDKTRFMCDRFHYKGHICNSVHDPDSYPSSDKFSTSGAESLNKLWANSKNSVRFLNPENLMPFLIARASIINLKSHYREKYKKADMEDSELSKFSREKVPCTCRRCVSEESQNYQTC